jgi:drug/metabolite transporter (DMT)-like permease
LSQAPSRGLPIAVLGLGILAISISSILVRWAQQDGVHSLAIAAWRVTIAGTLLALMAVVRRGPKQATLSPALWGWTTVAGGLLAIHFAAWIVALESTSIALCTVLLATNPLWVAILAALVLREKSSPMTWAGISVAFAALAGQTLFSLATSATLIAGTGTWLALISAMSFAAYILIGRHLRGRISLGTYFAAVTLAAAIILIVICVFWRVPMTGYSIKAWMCLAALAVVSHLIGHGALNWAARRMQAAAVAMATLGEPVGAAVLAWLLLGEVAGAGELTVMGFILAGIALVLWGESRVHRAEGS